jgi:hypothetical protein
MATVSKDQVQRAVQALLTHYEKEQAAKAKQSKAKELLAEDDTLSLVITWKKIPKQKGINKHGVGPLLKPLAVYVPLLAFRPSPYLSHFGRFLGLFAFL